jgi:phosphoglycerate dehydrogenase-like enzyme
MTLNLMFLRRFSSTDTKYLKDNLSETYNVIIPEDFSRENLVRLAAGADVFLGNAIFKELIDAAVNLKVIQAQGAGVDNMDLKLLSGNNIILCNSHVNAWYVAEHAVGMLFSLIKKIHIHDRFVREGRWFVLQNEEEDYPYLSDSIKGNTVGLIGFGHIARHIVRFLTGFEVTCIAHKRKKGVLLPNDNNQSGIKFYDLQTMLSKSDIVFVALPLTEQTRDIVSEQEFNIMKKTAYLVNVSRGPVVNQKSLYEALEERQIAGAAIDVWYDDVYKQGDKKYPSQKYPFHNLENILLSPYRAGYIRNGSPHLTGAVENLILYAAEGRVTNVVDIEAGY